MGSDERRRVLEEWNDETFPFPEDACLHELFESVVRESPRSEAVVAFDERLTYEELDRRANRVAGRLRSLGVAPGDRVGLWMDRSADLLVAIFGTLKAGGAYVPLDPDFPADRIVLMLTDCGARVVVTRSALRASLPDTGADVVVLDDGSLEGERDETVETRVRPHDLAYVIYTSGSTGRPKGVAVEHRSAVALVSWLRTLFSEEELGGLLFSTSMSFDVSVFEMFTPLTSGGRIILAENALSIRELPAASEIKVISTVPSAMVELLGQGDLPPSASTMVMCGEPLKSSLVEAMYRQASVERVLDLYGPTECTVFATWAHRTAQGPNTIGRPIPNYRSYILDEELEPVPVGEVGELYLAGSGVAREYLNRPGLTAERFLPDPFDAVPGRRMYRTGDLARYFPDGNIEFLGRIDNQVKVRGYRIELGEIETVLERHPAVRQAVVLAREDEPGEKRLVAYCVTDSEVRPAELKAHLGGQVPAYMVPPIFVYLEALPRTPNGKVDRKALPAPSADRRDVEQDFVEPRGDLERFVADCWHDILKIEQVGADDDFFELGGDSLQAAQFINRMQRELGEAVFIVSVFDAPTVAEYAEFLSREYAAPVARRFGLETESGSQQARVDEGALERFRACVPRLSTREGVVTEDGPPNAPAIFVLAPPRSGTSLFRVMLAGHPGLFAAAELQLLGFHTLRERSAAYSGRFSLWLEGTVRALMELRGCDADEAKGVMLECERRGLSTKGFYGRLQEWIGDRVLVDKSPSYALDPAALAKAEADFREPMYVHLVRHPYAVVKSFEQHHLDQVLYLEPHDFSPSSLAELVWLESHRTILDFLETVPAHRQARVSFERLVREPRTVMEAMCGALGLQFHEGLLTPYEDIETKMTDGIYPESMPMGDTKLRARRRIDPTVADSWKGVLDDDFLGDPTWEVAARLGYERPR